MRRLALYSIKGGVGKTAGAVNLAYLAAAAGLRVLLWDLDPQAASTFYLRVHPKKGGARRLLAGKLDLDRLIKASDFPGLDLLPARFSFRKADLAMAERDEPVKRFNRLLKPLAAEYDLLVFDCAPGLSTMSETVLACSDLAMVPVIPTPLSLRTLDMLVDHVATWPKPVLAPFFSMVDRRKQLHRQIIEAPELLRVAPAQAHVPYASQVEQMGVHRAPLATYAAGCAAERAYRALWREAAGRLGGLPSGPD